MIFDEPSNNWKFFGKNSLIAVESKIYREQITLNIVCRFNKSSPSKSLIDNYLSQQNIQNSV